MTDALKRLSEEAVPIGMDQPVRMSIWKPLRAGGVCAKATLDSPKSPIVPSATTPNFIPPGSAIVDQNANGVRLPSAAHGFFSAPTAFASRGWS